MTPDMYIKRAVYLCNYVILFETVDGETRTIDFKQLMNEDLGAFNSIKDENNFRKFYLDNNVLTWDIELPAKNDKHINQFDIAPEYIYEHSVPLVPDNGGYRIVINEGA